MHYAYSLFLSRIIIAKKEHQEPTTPFECGPSMGEARTPTLIGRRTDNSIVEQTIVFEDMI